jgi:hypothetical protein
MQHDPTGRKNKLVWQWLRGAATTIADFGHPETTDDYRLCIYSGGTLFAEAAAPAGGRCGVGVPCWRTGARTLRYRNRDLLPDGLRSLTLRTGEAERAQILAQGQGAELDLPPLAGLASPVVVEVKRASGACFAARYTFPPALENGSSVFRDRAD